MNKFDVQFWNGVLKGIEIAREELEESEKSGCEECIKKLSEVREKVLKLHGEDIRSFLKQY